MPEGIIWDRLMANCRETVSGCWEWTASCGSHGYGQFWTGVSNDLAHRASYIVAVGPIPDGLQIDHLCRNRKCINPEHLEAVTQQENMRRASEAQTACRKAGHPFTPENTIITTAGHRKCRTCYKESQRRHYARKRAESNL